MNEEDLKLIISKYQQKLFEVLNSSIVLETQVEKLTKNVSTLSAELEKIKKSKRGTKPEGEFE